MEKAAKALKEKGETPEELLRSIKENEAAAAEAQRTVDAWKAIVGEKSRREEAAKAEAERIATEKAEAERKAAEERERAEKEEKARIEAERKAEEERKTKEEERKERDENGQPFVVSSDGTTTFGEIAKDTGLTVAPIKLSEGVADEMGNGYGLRHIEARHGDQIRKAGFSSVEEFIEQVAKNYDVIKEGSDRNGNKTYRLLLTDKHNNTLMIELSKDGSYWNVNTAGVFKKSYGKDKKEVYNRHTTVKQSAETAETSQADEHSGTQSTSRMNVPTTSADKGSEISEEKQGKEQGKMDVVDVDNPQSWVGHTFTGIKGLFKGQQFVCEGLDGDKAVFHLKTADDDFKFSITKMRDMFARGWLRVENADLKRGNESVFDIAAAIAKKEGKEAAERQERMDGYTADMPPMRRARVRKTLGKELNYRNFGVMTEGEFVESMVAAGGIVTADFHNGKMRRLIDINDGELGHLKYPVSKAAADYAVYLGAKVNESELVNAKTEARMHEIRRKYADEDERGMFDNEEWLDREIGNSSRDKRKQERYEDLTEYKKLKEERDAKFNAHLRKSEKKQEKQSVFDKAKEIADKEEKKRKAEADKPKQKPLTEAERKDAEEVAGALGYRVEWVDTMEENGTIDADKKVIRIAKDAENPLVQVLGHEVAHGVKRMNGGKFKALQKAAMEVVGEKEWNERIGKKRGLNAYAEGKLAEEVTCDIVGEALNDKDALKRLAESLRGERGILARLRDAVAKMVEYFKNRGDKEGVRRMKAADKLLAEFESALKEGVVPEQVKPEDVDRSVRENRSEKTELTAEERELRDNLVERMRKGGLDVVTDSEEMQRVIDTENERTRNKRSKKSEAARKRDEALYAVDWSTAFVSGKSREEATEIRRERGRKFKEETKELYGRVLSGNFDDVTLRLIDKFVDNSTPNNPYERPISKRLPARALQKMRGGERTGSIDALFSRISESAVGKDGKALPRAERERAIEEKKKELLKKWAIATGNWHTDIADFTDQREPIGSGTDSDVYLGKDGKSVIKVSKGKPYGKRFRPDVDNVALFNTVFPGSRYTIEGYGEIDGKFVRFLKQPIVDFTSSTPLTEGERVAYMEKLGFKPINKENTAFSNGEIIASDLQKSNIVKDKQGNVRVIDADMKLHTKDFGGKFSYPDAETDTRTAGGEVYTGSVREHRVYHGSGADFDAFDHSHMGEGEGAQAYGWGTYVTEVEGIGRTYAIQNTTKHNDALRALQHDVDAISDQLNRHRDDLKYDEEQLKRANEWRAEAELDYELFKDEAEKLKEKYGESSPKYQNHLFYDIYTDEMKRAQSSVKSTEESIQYRKEKIAELEKALKDKQAEIDELPKEFPRHLYTVEIPDDNGSNYLDWNGHPAESLLKDVGSFLESNGFERVQDSPVRYEKGESTVVLNPNATGADLYAELREALGSDKKASQALAELGCIGIKYPADNMRGGRKDGAKNYVIFNENDAKITDHTRFLRTASGEVYGLVKDGRIYLDPKVATAETAVHEYTHLWGDMLRRKDSEQWSHTVKELKNSVLWEEVKESYPELKTDDEIADEVLSTFSGRRGAERLREEARRVADGDGGVFTKAKAIETLERVKKAIARFWEGVARMFGINRYRSAEELADMAMKDLLDSKNPMKDESGMRKRGEVGETLATSGTYFSGGGLLEAGLKGVIDPKVAVEFSEKIAGVYADNHGNHIVVADVRDVDPKKLVGAVDGGEVQYFHASPVCKNFSKAKREGGEVELDKETALSTAEFIAKTRPKVVTIENVKGYRNSEALKIITDELTRQGYDWDADVYNAADYGGYTKRERLIVRAKRDGKLPPKPEKLPEELRKKGWYSAVEDLIPHLEEKKTGVPQGTDERLKNSGIDYRTIDKPLYVFGRGYANKTVGHAFADELLPTLTTGGGDIIIMPDGRVLKASPRVLARVTGLPDTYKMPETDQLSHTIVGNGIPTQLTEGVIAPLLDNAIPSAERATKRESVFDVADRVSQNLEERTRAMGSRVEKRMADVAQKLEGREFTAEQKAVVDVFSGKSDNQKFSVEREDGKKVSVVVRKGTETSAGTKHSLYRHYNTNVGTITTDDILLIPQIIKEGEIKRIRKGNEQYVEYTQKIGDKKLTTLMQIVNGKEVFNNFYSNKKGSELPASRNAESIDNTPEGAHNINSEPSAKVEDKSESPKLFGEEIIDDGKM